MINPTNSNLFPSADAVSNVVWPEPFDSTIRDTEIRSRLIFGPGLSEPTPIQPDFTSQEFTYLDEECINVPSTLPLCLIGNPGPTVSNVVWPEPFDSTIRDTEIRSRLIFGPGLSEPTPIQPDFTSQEFTYLDEECINVPSTLPLCLIGNPGPSPSKGYYSTARPFKLYQDKRYTSGAVYITPYDLTKHYNEDKSNIPIIQTPPECEPVLVDGKFVLQPIPHMIKMIPGIPFAIHVNGDPTQLQTVGCLHTLDSLQAYPDYDLIHANSVNLAKLTWGCSGLNGEREIPAVYTLNLKRNDRNGPRAATHRSPYDGSFSLGNTILKGDGQGTVVPALQMTANPSISSQIQSILQTLHTLYIHVLPKSISRFENDMINFHSEFSNIYSLGGLSPCATSVQLNISSLGETLEESIGNVQGLWHTDHNDDPDRFTLFILLLRVGPDGHPGPFCLGRWGLYSAEMGCWIIFLTFKGIDVHSGFAPCELSSANEAFLKDSNLKAAYNMAKGPNRAGYVLYTSKVAAHRTSALNATLPTSFGNLTTSKTATKFLTFGSSGPSTLGSPEDCANRLAREAVFDFFNTLSLSQLNLELNLDDVLSKITFTTSDGSTKSMKKLKYNPQTDSVFIQRYLGLYFWYHTLCKSVHIRITRSDIQRSQGQLSHNIQGPLAPATKIHVQPIASPLNLQHDQLNSPDQVAAILSARSSNDKKITFLIRLKDSSRTISVSADHPCLNQHPLVIQWYQAQLSREDQQMITASSQKSKAASTPNTNTSGRSQALQSTGNRAPVVANSTQTTAAESTQRSKRKARSDSVESEEGVDEAAQENSDSDDEYEVERFREYRQRLGLIRSRSTKLSMEEIHAKVTELRSLYPKAGVRDMLNLLFFQDNISIPRNTLTSYFRQYEPERIQERKAGKLKRRRFWAAGVLDMICVDQHDKWKKFGLALHTGVEPFSGKILWIRVWHSNNNPRLILSYYLKFLETHGAMPLITQSDAGTENYGIANAQSFLRQYYDPQLQGTLQHRFMSGGSKNVKAEIIWSQYRRRFAPGYEDLLEKGEINGWFEVNDELDRLVHRWLFIPWLQTCLDGWVDMFNCSRKRADSNKILPHGVPNDIFQEPERYGALNFGVDQDGLNHVRQLFAPPEHAVFQLIPPDLEPLISHTYADMGSPLVKHDTIWGIFCQLRDGVSSAINPDIRTIILTFENGLQDDQDVFPVPAGRQLEGGINVIRWDGGYEDVERGLEELDNLDDRSTASTSAEPLALFSDEEDQLDDILEW
ncbi:hypothetical protein CVT24_007318 [Panaeolus cyanescens]|uniref:Integrase core domain-containing protein n=1 Tax=Panaeolus cyanescens TaxID=181874 RepID=A0A409YX53_9AGAR|nr:hypothetical protein CVT24_007318 [Panaeolus cyanescens]